MIYFIVAYQDQKIVLILTAPFPTQKAYGITTKETISALDKLFISNRIYCIQGNYTDDYYAEIRNSLRFFSGNWYASLFMKLSRIGKGKIFYFAWYLSIFSMLISSIKDIKKFEPSIIWVRDPILAFWAKILFPDAKIILELHDYFSSKKLWLITRLKKGIFLFPTNKLISERLLEIKNDLRLNLAPLGITTNNKIGQYGIQSNICQPSKKIIQIGYIGKFSIGGYSKGIEDLIELSRIYQRAKENFAITLLGANSEEKYLLDKLKNKLGVSNRYLKIETYVAHSKISKIMEKFDILVLPATLSKNYQGIPLKLLEYLASGKLVIVARTPVIENFFTEEFRPYFYEAHNSESLHKVIKKALSNPNLNKHISKSVIFASKFTWDRRTADMIKSVTEI